MQWRLSALLDRISSQIETRQSRVDIPKLQQFNGELTDKQRLKQCSTELQNHYEDYCTRYSHKVHVVSCEQAAFVLNACRVLQPRRLVDFGSGFSSYVLRKYAQESRQCMVWSVDDDEQWMLKTIQFLREQGLPTDGVMMAEAFFTQHQNDRFDFIFYDLGNMRTREDYFERMLPLRSEQSMAMIDDVHKQDYRSFVVKVLKEQGIPYYNLKNITLDEYGRYAFAIIGNRNTDRSA